ncbi:MAG: chorismate synthase [Saprospiraceae bacterium]|nr:chorismate synthase [Candidatus Opimibacter skivensis]
MASNSLGRIFRITTAGESHGAGMGVIIDGCPAGIEIDTSFIQKELDRRKPGQSSITTQRKEGDKITIQSGVYEGKSTGAPILMLIPNEDSRPSDYDQVEQAFRPSHADYTYHQKYGTRDHRGGGRSSARETVNWVAAGAIAKMILHQAGIKINAAVSSVGSIQVEIPISAFDWEFAEQNPVRCPDPSTSISMLTLIEETRDSGDTIGGTVTCVIEGCPAGLGEPVFHKLHADLGHAMLSINACKGFEYGSGFEGSKMRGSEHNDVWSNADDGMKTTTNNSGGIQGGISNGMPIYFKVAFKPVSTLMTNQNTVDTAGDAVIIKGKGRHDPCVVPRAVPIVEALAALVLVDHWLLSKAYQ